MFMTADDVLKIGAFFMGQNELTEKGVLADALQSNANQRGLTAIENILYYNNGFWAKKFKGSGLNCSEDVWIPFMSGFGGITVAFMPNQAMYYYFSDNQEYSWDRAVNASNRMSPFCKSN